MYRIFLLLGFFLLLNDVNGQGIEFYEGDWKEALELAKAEDKLVFVDAFAKWCGPCKMMAKKVFTDAEVGDFYNEEFINLKIDMEEAPGLEFGGKYPVRAYPTLIFLDGDGNIVLKKTGARQAEGLINLGKEAIFKYDRSAEYASQYEEGERDAEFMIKYVRELNKVGKPSLKIANEYLRSDPKIRKEQYALFVMEATIEADSRIFDLFIEHRKIAEKKTSKKEVEEKISQACHNTVTKGIEYESDYLIDEAKAKMKKYNKDHAEAFNYETDIRYAISYDLEEEYLKGIRNYCKKIINKDALALNRLSNKMESTFPNSSKVLDEAEKICKKSIKLEKSNVNFRLSLVKIQLSASKTQDALKTAKEALDLATQNGENTRQIEGMIKYIEAQLEKA